MILTYKIKHNRDFSTELRKARQIAEVALETKTQSSKDVKQFGLKSIIANQILREYARNRKINVVRNVNLIVPKQGVSFAEDTIHIPSLKLDLQYKFPRPIEKINQIELDKEFAHVSVSVKEPMPIVPKGFIGVDLNTTGHVAVMGNPETGKVLKLGKEALHIHNKYKTIRKSSQKNGKFGILKRIRTREHDILKNLNHQISRKIVSTAVRDNYGIKLEELKGIRQTRKHRRNFNLALHSWSFRQLQSFIEYKARLCGIPIVYVEPRYTSQDCSRCGSIGTRQGKEFVCNSCAHFDHADANASFNIALRPPLEKSIGQLNADRDAFKGSTDTPRGATL